jgi:ribosomal protein S18 acetylase RimI-like enzyme
MADDIEVRRLTPEDVAAFRELRLEALLHSPEGFASTYESEAERPLEWFVTRLTDAEVFAAVRDRDLLGMAGFRAFDSPKMAHKGMIWGMYVRPDARGLGVGRRILQAILDHAAGRVEQVQLAVTTDNAAAKALYEAMGFVEYGRELHSLKVGERYWDDVLLARRV